MATDLYGDWVLALTASGASSPALVTRLHFKQNPEFAESLAGEFIAHGQRTEVFGDIENGLLDLEESTNGKDINALWKGAFANENCTRAITGTRRVVGSQSEQTFVLRRAGW